MSRNIIIYNEGLESLFIAWVLWRAMGKNAETLLEPKPEELQDIEDAHLHFAAKAPLESTGKDSAVESLNVRKIAAMYQGAAAITYYGAKKFLVRQLEKLMHEQPELNISIVTSDKDTRGFAMEFMEDMLSREEFLAADDEFINLYIKPDAFGNKPNIDPSRVQERKRAADIKRAMFCDLPQVGDLDVIIMDRFHGLQLLDYYALAGHLLNIQRERTLALNAETARIINIGGMSLCGENRYNSF